MRKVLAIMRTPPLLTEVYTRKAGNRPKTQSMQHFHLKGQTQFSERQLFDPISAQHIP